jgi:SET domain-containing protein
MPAKLSPSRHLRIARSRAGLGLFARVPIRKGQFIARYSGRKIRTETADDLDTRYLFEINTRWTIDGATRKNTARYINHSCRPNAEVYFVKHAVKIRAIKNIKAGDEITYHYGRNYFEAFIKPVGCKCLPCAQKRAKQRAESRAKQRIAKQRARRRRTKIRWRRSTRH